MNFYYNPILGLQYTYLGDLFIIDIEMLPQNFNEMTTEDIFKMFIQQKVQWVDSIESPFIEIVLNITEYRL